MAVQSNSDEGRTLRKLVPLATFPSAAFAELCTNTMVEYIQDGTIFKRGDTNTDLVYLLTGSVTLQAEGLIVEVINSDSDSAKFALAHQIPRKIDAVANGLAHIVRLDANTVNNPPPAVYNDDLGYTVIEDSGESSDDWMTTVLRLPIFQLLSANNLQKIVSSLKTQPFTSGDVIIGQGKEVDFFYIIHKGQCVLSRPSLGEVNEIKLTPGDSFGEEYLSTDCAAQETVTALTDLNLILLEKKLFLSQIKIPTVTYITHEELSNALGQGAILLDVRPPHFYENQNLGGSANIPLLTLRMRLAEIPKDKQIIVVCANGKASEAAAFLLIKNKFNAVVLKGGMGIEESDEDDIQAEKFLEPIETAKDLASNPESSPILDSAEDEVENRLSILSTENQKLKQVNHELEEKIAQLQAEKDQAVARSQVLTQQLERLKEILNRLTKSK